MIRPPQVMGPGVRLPGEVAITDSPAAVSGDHSLHVDDFGLSIGSVSVGLPFAGTAEDVYRRYLDLMRLLQRGPVSTFVASEADVSALAAATGADVAVVARRLRALQTL